MDNKKQIDELQRWFEENEKLPEQIDRILLQRFFKCMYEDIEGTKSLIELNYNLRNKHPHIFLQRDPTDEDSEHTFEYADMILLPGLTPEKYKVCCYRLCDYNPNKVQHTNDTKAFFMVSDCRFSMPDVEDGIALAEGEVQIFDMTGYTIRHVTKLTVSTLQVYMKFLQEAFPVRLKAIHVINCPPYLDKIVSVLKPFISKEVYKMIHFHTEGIESLYEHIPRDMLPTEYGGNAGTIAEMKAHLRELLLKKREYLMDEKRWKIKGGAQNSNRWFIFKT